MQAEEVGFTLGIAIELEIGERNGDVQAFVDSVAGPSYGAEQHQRNGGQLHQLALGGVLGAVARGDVRNFVGHHAGEFGFFLRAEDQAAVDIEKSTRQCEGVDFVGIDHFDGEGHARIGIAHQVLPHAVHVFGDHRVIDQLGGALDFLRESLAEGDFVLQRIQIDAFADAAIANGFHVFLGVFGIDGILLLDRLLLPGLGLLGCRLRFGGIRGRRRALRKGRTGGQASQKCDS